MHKAVLSAEHSMERRIWSKEKKRHLPRSGQSSFPKQEGTELSALICTYFSKLTKVILHFKGILFSNYTGKQQSTCIRGTVNI